MTDPKDVNPRIGEIGPRLPKSMPEPYRRARYARPRPTNRPLAFDVKLITDSHGDTHHAFLEHNGLWRQCSGRGRCRECNKDEAMESTEKRLRDVLTEHFGEYMQTLPLTDGIFAQVTEEAVLEGRRLGDTDDMVDLRSAIELEFRITFALELLVGNPPLQAMIDLVDSIVAVTYGSPH